MKAILHKLFPYAPYLNEYIGFEKDIPDNSTDEEALKAVEHLRELAEKSHADKYPYLYTESGKPITIEQVIVEDRTEEDVLIQHQFEETKLKIQEAKTKAEAGQILMDSGFKLNIELQKLVNEKIK